MNHWVGLYTNFKTFSVNCWLYYNMKRGPFYSVEILSRIKSSKSFCSNSAKAQPTKFVQDDFQTERINNTHTHTHRVTSCFCFTWNRWWNAASSCRCHGDTPTLWLWPLWINVWLVRVYFLFVFGRLLSSTLACGCFVHVRWVSEAHIRTGLKVTSSKKKDKLKMKNVFSSFQKWRRCCFLFLCLSSSRTRWDTPRWTASWPPHLMNIGD